jgi:hypothetical protein
MGIVESKGKVFYLVKWKGFPPKQDVTHENYKNPYSVGGKEELGNFPCKNPESQRDPALTKKK